MKIIIASFFALVSLNVMAQTNHDMPVTYSANKDTLFILDPHAASTMVSVWKQTYNYTEHSFVNNNGETVQYWQTAPTNKPSVIILKNTDKNTYASNVQHTVIVNHGDTIQSWCSKPNTISKTSIASSKVLGKGNTAGAGLKQ